jgi:hypothetical protein
MINYGVNDHNPGTITVLKVNKRVMGEARSTQGSDKNGVPSSNHEAHKPIDNITVTILWFCLKHNTDVSVQIELATYNLRDSCHHIRSANLQTVVHT